VSRDKKARSPNTQLAGKGVVILLAAIALFGGNIG